MLDVGANVNARDKQYGTPLHAAISNGDEEIAKLLLGHGADVNDGNFSHLRTAVFRQSYGLFKALIAHGADLSSLVDDYEYTLNHCCETGDVTSLEILLDLSADLKSLDSEFDIALQAVASSFCVAVHSSNEGRAHRDTRGAVRHAIECMSDYDNPVELLVKLGAAINNGGRYQANLCPSSTLKFPPIPSLLQLGHRIYEEGAMNPNLVLSYHGLRNIVLWLLQQSFESGRSNPDNRSPLCLAILEEHYDIAKLLLDRGVADVNKTHEEHWTPLTAAASKNQVEIIELLLKRCDVDLNHTDPEDGLTALSVAAGKGHKAVVELLLSDVRVDLDLPDVVGRTALFHAANGGHDAIIHVLVAHGLSPTRPDLYGSTPLSAAARRGHLEAVSVLLISYTASMSPDCLGRTPLWWARRQRHSEIERLLLEHGQRNDASLDNETSPAAIMKVDDSLENFCNICLFSFSERSGHYNCSICCRGFFSICEDCFSYGGRCLDQSHVLVYEQKKWDEE